MPSAAGEHATSAGLARRAAALLYEALLLAALLLAGSIPLVVIAHGVDRAIARPLLQGFVIALAGVYFGWQWCRGQTLPMKTWRMRIVTRAGARLTPARAAARFAFALAGTLALGAGFLWALVDRDGLFLHDRLAGTRIVFLPDDPGSESRVSSQATRDP